MNPPALRTSEPRKEIIVAVVKRESTLLLLKRSFSKRFDPDRWEFVSGLGKEGITDWAHFAADRVRHETSLIVTFVSQGKDFMVTDRYGEWLIRPFLFEASSDEVQVQPDDHDAYRWIKPKELKDLKCVKDLAKNLAALGIK
jgi:isopentenyldiphosphate isomerase